MLYPMHVVDNSSNGAGGCHAVPDGELLSEIHSSAGYVASSSDAVFIRFLKLQSLVNDLEQVVAAIGSEKAREMGPKLQMAKATLEACAAELSGATRDLREGANSLLEQLANGLCA